MSFSECCPHSALEECRADLASMTASADKWREQALAQDREIIRLKQKIERLKFVRDENARRSADEIAQLRQQSSRLRCVTELLDAAQDFASGFIGSGIVEFSGYDYDRGGHVRLDADFRRRTDERLRKALHDAQKETAPGASSGYSTPFRETCTRLLGIVREAGGRIAVKDAMTSLRHHHYSSNACARASLIERTERGIVPMLRLHREGRAAFFEVTS